MKKLELTQTQLAAAAAHLATASMEKDMALAQEIGRLFDCPDPYEYAALHFFRQFDALRRVQERLNCEQDSLAL